MGLSDLLEYENIVIQCHDNPDADSLGAGFALYRYFKSKRKSVRLCYGGENEISQPSLLVMIKELGIPIEYLKSSPSNGLLVTVDFQYGTTGNTMWDCENAAVIDHHDFKYLHEKVHYRKINNKFGSCCTVVWSLLSDEGIEKELTPPASTGLYYGLYTDTAGFSQISYPVDRDMRDILDFDKDIFLKLINTDMSAENQQILDEAVKNYYFDEKNKTAVSMVKSCDNDLLGIVGDYLLNTENINVSVAYGTKAGGCKLSVRSKTNEVRADDLAQFICEGAGSGGGQRTKAGGFLSEYLFDDEKSEDYNSYIINKINEYYCCYKIIYADTYKADLSTMTKYVKRKVNIGAVRLSDFLRTGTPVIVRTLEGDLECISADDLYIMVGIDGEVYPIREKKFLATYEFTEGEPEYECEYEPTIHNTLTGEAYPISEYVKTCCAKGTSYIYAKQVNENIKVFTQWDNEKYLCGASGDFLAVREDDTSDVYMIQEDIFYRSYERSL